MSNVCIFLKVVLYDLTHVIAGKCSNDYVAVLSLVGQILITHANNPLNQMVQLKTSLLCRLYLGQVKFLLFTSLQIIYS